MNGDYLNLFFRIPSGVSPDLRDLLLCLLRRNAKDRISYESFFVHPFLLGKKAAASPGEPSLAANLRRRVSKSGVLAVDMPPLGGTPPAKAKSPLQQQLEQELQLVKLAEQQQKEREEQEAQEEENTGRCPAKCPKIGTVFICIIKKVRQFVRSQDLIYLFLNCHKIDLRLFLLKVFTKSFLF